MEDEIILSERLDVWSLEDNGGIASENREFPVSEANKHLSNDKDASGITADYLELSEDDDSMMKPNLGGIDTVGLTDDENCQLDVIPDVPDLERNPWDGLPYSSQYYDLLETREKLAVWQAKDDFILGLDESQIVLVTGRAGTGKSTQIPQWCAHFAREVGFEYGTVVCAQPHALAAASLALQVSKEMDLTSIGNEVGYKIPFSDVTTEDTMLRFCTDKELLREMAEDPLLERYGIVIVDEVQERTVASDILLSLLKIIASHRETIKIVVISLPHEMPKLEEYFDGVPVVDLTFMEENSKSKDDSKPESPRSPTPIKKPKLHFKRTNELRCDYVSDAVETIMKCHCDQNTDGDILVFMPGEEEISDVCERVAREAAMKVLRGEAGDLIPVPLHLTSPYGTQQAVYDISEISMAATESGLRSRKVIVCDSIAESSFSIDNIAVVIDSGRRRSNAYDCRTRARSNFLCYTTKLSADLRYQRCKEDGHVYRLYTKLEFQKFEEVLPPAVSREELTTDVLLMKRLLQRLDEKFSSCQTLDPPAPDAYMQALEDLDYHGALDENGDLSDLGAVMSEIPVSLPLAKCLVASCGEQCTEEMLTITAMLVVPFHYLQDKNKSGTAFSSRKALNNRAGDHFTLLSIYEAFIASKQSEHWCKENFVDFTSLKWTCKVRDELVSVMNRLELPMSPKITKQDILETRVKKALLAGYFMQIAKDVDGCGNYLIARDRHVSRLSKSATLLRYADWVLYHNFVLSDSNNILTVTAVTAEMIVEISPSSYLANLPVGEAKDALLAATEAFKSHASSHEDVSKNEQHDKSRNESVNKANASQEPQETSDKRSNHGISIPSVNQAVSSGTNKDNGLTAESRNPQLPECGKVNTGEVVPTDPVSDIFNATARELSNAYQQASDYVRNYSADDNEAQEGCVMQ